MTVAETSWAAAAWGRFWTPERQRIYPWLLVGLIAFWWLVFNVYQASNGDHYGGDFVTLYSAGDLALDGRAEDVYDPRLLSDHQQEVIGVEAPDAFLYPPPLLLVLAPLSALPYGLSLLVWLLGTGLALALVIRGLAKAWGPGLTVAMICPIFVNVAFGQNGFLVAALISGTLLTRASRPGLSGVLLAGSAYKPQFAVIPSLAATAERRWRLLAVAAAAFLGFVTVSVAFLGADAWVAFSESTNISRKALLADEVVDKRISAFGAILGLGLPAAVAAAGHAIVAIPVFVTCVRMWRASHDVERTTMVSLLAAIIVSPYSFVYDFAIALPSMAMVYGRASQGGWTPGARFAVGACSTAALWSWPVAAVTGIQLGFLVLLALFMVVARTGESASPSLARLGPRGPLADVTKVQNLPNRGNP